MARPRLILASSSPRRSALLGSLGIEFDVRPAHIDESVRPGEPPRTLVERLAREKAEAVTPDGAGWLVLGADTVVVLGDEILGKPRDSAHAQEMLCRLSGRTHLVLTAVALAGQSRRSRLVQTSVEFRRLSKEEVAWYADSDEPLDKAGGYAIQGIGGFLVSAIRGSPSSVIGLPLAETVELLEESGVLLPWRSS